MTDERITHRVPMSRAGYQIVTVGPYSDGAGGVLVESFDTADKFDTAWRRATERGVTPKGIVTLDGLPVMVGIKPE